MSHLGRTVLGMATWTEFSAEAPEIAELAERRLAATGLMMIATLRRDGFPRISPLEPVIADGRLTLHDGRLWLGMMVDSTKSRDLQRDGRFALHSATADKMVTEGDVKMWGVATQVTDHDTLAQFASSVGVESDAMFVKTWRPGAGVTVVEKRD